MIDTIGTIWSDIWAEIGTVRGALYATITALILMTAWTFWLSVKLDAARAEAYQARRVLRRAMRLDAREEEPTAEIMPIRDLPFNVTYAVPDAATLAQWSDSTRSIRYREGGPTR